MTRPQMLLALAGVGVAFVGGSLVQFQSGDAYALLIHAVRIEVVLEVDGGLRVNPDGGNQPPDVVTVWRTRAAPEGDGGFDFEDEGPASCTGPTAAARAFVRNSCLLPDAGQLTSIYVIEARPANVSEDGGLGVLVLEAYGSNGRADCILDKPQAFRTFLNTLNCGRIKTRGNGKAL